MSLNLFSLVLASYRGLVLTRRIKLVQNHRGLGPLGLIKAVDRLQYEVQLTS